MDPASRPSLTRRGFLQASSALAGGLTLARSAGRVLGDAADPYSPFRVGIQTYSLRAFGREKMLRMTRDLGLRHIESYSVHFPPTNNPAEIAAYKRLLREYGIEMSVLWADFTGDTEANRNILEFAKAMGIRYVTGAPGADAVASLDRLLGNYDVRVGIHNHGPGTPYSTMQDIANAITDHHKRIGLCNDTAWFLASKVDPIDAIHRFGDRLYGMHLKDMTADGKMTEMGKGVLDVEGVFTALLDVGFGGVVALEYEEHEQDPAPYIEECLAATRAAIQSVR